MLKINIGLSRKLSENFNSHGFSLNLEGEVCVDLRDTETVVERIQEYYDLADEALSRQIERYESEAAIAAHDEVPTPVKQPTEKKQPAEKPAPRRAPVNRLPANGSTTGEPATNKQIQFLLNLSKRQGLSKSGLEDRIAEQFGHKATVYDLTKKEAGLVLDSLMADATTGTRS
jgi:hypothetical protein